MQDAITVHIYAIYIFLAIMLFNLYSVLTKKDFISLAKRLKFMTPVYHLSNAIVIYTGTIVAFYAQYFSITIALMIPASIFLLVIEIKRYKKMRIIKTTDVELQEKFYIYAKKIYIIEILVLLAVLIISKVF
ncbi:putative membrane protein [Aliarcobacter lanthieri]|nr:putative membrane protein [Aliarcobacter lanthieri]